MIEPFDYTGSPARIVFGAGASARAGEMIAGLGCRRALVLATPGRAAAARALAEPLGDGFAGLFDGAAMHTPVDVIERALQALDAAGADCTLAIGGGSTTGLGKAIAHRRGTPQIVVPTTYAGSEATPILGQTENGVKTTLRHPSVLPEVVLYDPDLTRDLPPAITVTSALNAMAHAAEALYARDRNPVSSLMAGEGLRAFARALPVLRASPRDRPARAQALLGAWLCGTVLGAVGMALHHKLCHVLGGAFNLPHAETHAVILPHAVAFNEPTERARLRPVLEALGGGASAGAALHAFAAGLGAPRSLRDLGLAEVDLEAAADLAVRDPYWNPRPVTRDAVRALLQAAHDGRPPAS